MNDDASLLQSYANGGSEPAFAELVRRHVDLVYNAALRRTGGDAHRAADVSQHVFTALARNAGKLSRHPALGAWLHTATRNAALNLMTAEQRRQKREAEAVANEEPFAGTDSGTAWTQLRPVLDAAIDELPDADRVAVVLRFLERRAFADIGAMLKVSEDAARMRTERALDKLRAGFARRGITSTATALGALVAGQPLVSAPAGLAATLAAHSLAVAGTGVFTAIVASLTSIMTAKIITTAGLSAIVAFGLGAYLERQQPVDVPLTPPAETSRHDETIALLREDNERLKSARAGLEADLAQLSESHARLAAQPAVSSSSTPAALPKPVTLGMSRGEMQQAVLNNLRQIDAAREQYILEKGRAPASVHELVGRGAFIKTVRTVGGEDYAGLSMIAGEALTVRTPDGIEVTFDPAGEKTTKPEIPPEVLRVQELGARIGPSANNAFNAYRLANDGANPPNEEALLPFFETPQAGADFLEFLEARKAAGL